MSKRQIIMLLGVWIGIFLFLGVPSSWHKIFAVITGLTLIIIAYRLGSEASTTSGGDIPFVEHKKDLDNNTPA